MKTILLLSAAYLNGGAYADVGTEVPVGDGKAEITEYRADELVKAGRAEIVDDGEADEAESGSESGTTRQRRQRG